MGRKAVLVFILFLIVSGIFFMLPDTYFTAKESDYRPLFVIMEKAGAAVTGGELHYWASLKEVGSGEFTLQDLETIADELAVKLAGLGVEESGKAPVKEGMHLLVQREGRLFCGADMKLLLQPVEGEGERTVHLLLILSGEPGSLAELAARVPALLAADTVGGTMSFCLSGEIDREMKTDEMEELARLLVREIGGTYGQGICDGQMVSVTGYYPGLGPYFQAGRERLNLNIALRGNDLAGNTRIWAGTPLISGWY